MILPSNLRDFKITDLGVNLDDLATFPDGTPMLPGRKWYPMRPTAKKQIEFALSAEFRKMQRLMNRDTPCEQTALENAMAAMVEQVREEHKQNAEKLAKAILDLACSQGGREHGR